MNARTCLSLAALLTFACSSSGGAGSSGDTAGGGAGAGDGCPAPGMRAADDPACAPGPWSACPDGSKPRERGWGCEAILPETACAGATRDVLGQTECVPIGDCAAPFPPPEATLFVDAKAAPDATHFASIGAAVAAAPPGATIAVAPGTYSGGVKTNADVAIVGKCPAEVTFEGPGVDAFRVLAGKLTIRGMTITGFRLAIVPAQGTTVDIADSVLDGNHDDSLDLDDGGVTLVARRIAVRNTTPSPDGLYGYGMNAQLSSTVDIADSVFAGNHSGHIRLSTSAKATLDHVVFRDALPAPQRDFGYALVAQDGATATLTRSAVVNAYAVGIVAGDKTTMTLDEVLVGATHGAQLDALGRALNLFGGAQVTAKRFFAYDNHDVAIMVAEAGTHLALDASALVDTQNDGLDVSGRGITVQEGASADITATAIVGTTEAGIAIDGAGSRATVARSILAMSAVNGNRDFGDGILVADGAAVDVSDSEIAASARAGIAVGTTSSARVARARIRDNAIGLYAEDGTLVREADEPPAANEITITPDTLFLANGQRVGGGVLPLPQPLPAGK